MIAVYVDNLYFHWDQSSCHHEILKQAFDLEKDEDMASFLGVEITTTNKFGAKSLTQIGSIDCILCMTDMLEATRKATAVVYGVFGKDANGKPHIETMEVPSHHWNDAIPFLQLPPQCCLCFQPVCLLPYKPNIET